jgi:16S rRNA (cytosine1402-N4)-methyltransferase
MKKMQNYIKKYSKRKTIKKIDTQELVKIIEKSKRKKNYKVHSATKTFQALRIFVNKEISELIMV